MRVENIIILGRYRVSGGEEKPKIGKAGNGGSEAVLRIKQEGQKRTPVKEFLPPNSEVGTPDYFLYAA